MRKHPSDWVSSRKSVEVRVAAVVCVIIALATGKSVTTTFKDLYPTYAQQVKMDKKEFCETRYNNFMKTGTVSDQKRSGRPPKLPHTGVGSQSSIQSWNNHQGLPKCRCKEDDRCARMVDVH
jgi:hypothetical protein